MTDTIEPSVQRPSVCDTHRNDSTSEGEFVPLETIEPAQSRSRLRITAVLLALAVCTSDFSSCAFRILSRELTYSLAVSVHRGPGYNDRRDRYPYHFIRPTLRIWLFVDRRRLPFGQCCRRPHMGGHLGHLGPQAHTPRCCCHLRRRLHHVRPVQQHANADRSEGIARRR